MGEKVTGYENARYNSAEKYALNKKTNHEERAYIAGADWSRLETYREVLPVIENLIKVNEHPKMMARRDGRALIEKIKKELGITDGFKI